MTTALPPLEHRRKPADAQGVRDVAGIVETAPCPTDGMVAEERLSRLCARMNDAVLRGDGLQPVVKLASDALLATVAIIVPGRSVLATPTGDVVSSAQIARLERWVRERLRGRPCPIPAGVCAEVPIRVSGRTVGIVARLGSPGVESAANAATLLFVAQAARTEFSLEEARHEVEQRLRGSFLEELRSGRALDSDDIVRRAARLACDLSEGGTVLCGTPAGGRLGRLLSTIRLEYPGALAEQFERAGGQPYVLALLPAAGPSTRDAVDKLRQRVARLGTVACSTARSDPGELAEAIAEAELMLEVSERVGGDGAFAVEGRMFKLLLRMAVSQPEEVRAFYEATIAPLARYQAQYNTDLIDTLRAYLDANCNMNATASAIYAHRHTVSYRLERVRALTKLDPLISEDREQLSLGLKIHLLLAREDVEGVAVGSHVGPAGCGVAICR